MELITRPRAGGKTTELIKRVAESENGIYVAATQRQAEAAWQISQGLGYEIPRDRFIAANSAQAIHLSGSRALFSMKYYVDELEAVLSALLGGYVVAATETTKPATRGAQSFEEEVLRVDRAARREGLQ